MDTEALQFAPPEELAEACRKAAGPEVLDRLTEEIKVYDTGSIVTFGSGAAAEAAAAADEVLKVVQGGGLSDPAPVLEALGRVMGAFDPEELTEAEKPRRSLFRRAQSTPDQVLEKYRAMGGEAEKAYVALKQYEAEIRDYDRKLKALFDGTFLAYRRLVEHIRAAEQGCLEIQAHLRSMEAEVLREPGNAALQMDRDSLRNALALLERRAQDLRVGEILALQSLPAVQAMRRSNLGLIEKIHTAFLVTIPIFRQALGQALARKRLQLQNQAMEAVDRRAREALGQRRPAPAAGQPPEAMEAAWKTIMDGIAEMQALRREAGDRQAAEGARLAALRTQTP